MAKSCCPYLCSFGRIAQAVQPLHRHDRSGTACLVSSADRCSVSGVRACVPVRRVLRCLPCIWHSLCCCLRCAAVPGALGACRGTPAGHIAAAQPRPVSAAIKFFKEKGVFQRSSCQHPPHPHKTKRLSLCNIPNFPKNTKRPLSEPRLCYNQLKAIRQRKEESKHEKENYCGGSDGCSGLFVSNGCCCSRKTS